MNYLLKIFYFIKSRGITDENNVENELVALLNVISFSTFLGAFILFNLNCLFSINPVFIFLSLFVACAYAFVIFLNHIHRTQAAKLYIVTVAPLWHFFAILFIGGDFNQGISAMTAVVMVYLMYKENIKLRNRLIIYNMLIYILPTIYINFYPPIFGVQDILLDEVLAFLLSFGWIGIVFSLHEKKSLDYIKSLQAKNKELEQKTIELERFNHIASHDLKSPLRNISSFVSLISRSIKKKDYENIEEYIGYVQSGANQMNELIEGVLEISKIKRQSPSKYSVADLNIILEKVKSNLRIDIESKNAKIVAERLPNFYCYEPDFAILFQNFIQNGIKYNQSAEPRIEITTEERKNFITIHFTDNGIGIPEEYRCQIFDFFKRLHTSQEFPGTGLGLGICKKIINKYDGRIEVDSEISVFSTFSIHLPVTKIDLVPKKELESAMVN